MILRPRSAEVRQVQQSRSVSALSIWNAIFATQQQPPGWFITQADHAHLAGEIAAKISAKQFPRLTPEIVRAISLHDEGWYDCDSRGPVRSFITVGPVDFLPAWQSSIQAAEKVSELGGAIVSGHFVRLARTRMQMTEDTFENKRLVQDFVKAESARRKNVLRDQHDAAKNIEELTDVLQFCDVFSLYLCCGATERVEFPQKFAGTTFELRRAGEIYRSKPRLFREELRLKVSAIEIVANRGSSRPITLEFRLQ